MIIIIGLRPIKLKTVDLIYHNIHTFYVNFTVIEAPNYFVGPKRKASRPLFNLFQEKQKLSI